MNVQSCTSLPVSRMLLDVLCLQLMSQKEIFDLTISPEPLVSISCTLIEIGSYWRINTWYLSEKLGITERKIAQFKGDYGSPCPNVNQVYNRFPLMGKNNFEDITLQYQAQT